MLDVDGVVADARHRMGYLQRQPKDWPGFFRAAASDPACERGVALAAELAAAHDIVWLTGRPEWLRALTREWLDRLELPSRELRMRPRHDHRPAPAFKLGVLRELAPRHIATFVDDDREVVRAARAAGHPAVLADWLPRAPALRNAQDHLGRT